MLVMDTRELSKNREIFESLKSKVDIVVDTLSLGDYLILSDPPRLVERMTENEILSKRKMKQIEGMVKDNPEMKSFILFEGSIGNIFYWRKVHPNAVYGKLLGILDGWEVPILFSRDRNETVMWLSVLHDRATSKRESRMDVRPSPRSGASFKDQQLWLLSGIRGLGAKYAKRLLDCFGSVRNVFNASEEELSSVEGIGKKRAYKIVCLATGEER